MATIITQQDVDQLLYFAAFSAAQKVGVPEAELESVNTLTATVRAKNKSLGSALETFIAAYINWFMFTEEIEAEGKSGNLSHSENKRLMKLMEARDNSRASFISALKARA